MSWTTLKHNVQLPLYEGDNFAEVTTSEELLQGLSGTLHDKDIFSDEALMELLNALLLPCKDRYIRENMTYDMALDMIAAEGKTVIEDLELTSPQIADAIGIYYHNDINYSTENPNTLPYILCMEYPTAAASLYEELKYWASKGRI